jgi:hypothetical protein
MQHAHAATVEASGMFTQGHAMATGLHCHTAQIVPKEGHQQAEAIAAATRAGENDLRQLA